MVQTRTLSHTPRFAILLAGAFAIQTACSSESTDSGTGDAGTMDAQDNTPDADPQDAGPRDIATRDATTPDSAHYCTENENVQIGVTDVHVGEASMMSLAAGMRPDLFCAHPAMGTFNDSIFIRGCVNIIGTPPSMAELASLEFSIHPALTAGGAANDPTFDPTTGAERGEKLPITVHFDNSVAVGTCPSQLQVELGFDAPAAEAIVTEKEYIIRVRTATAAATQLYATQYFLAVKPRNDNITHQGGPGDCTSQTCYHRQNFTVLRKNVFSTAINSAGVAIPGSLDLRDGMGAGYAAIEMADCDDRPMQHAVAGFWPAPLADGYVSGASIDIAAVDSDVSGIYIALGFPGMDEMANLPQNVTAAVGANRDGTCTEEYAGGTYKVYPDAISVIRTGRETSLRER